MIKSLIAISVGTVGIVSAVSYINLTSAGLRTFILSDFKSDLSKLRGYIFQQAASYDQDKSQRWSYAAHAKELPNLESFHVGNTEDLESIMKRRNEIMKFGYPTLDNIKYFDDYILAYSNAHRAPLWVCEHLTKENVDVKDNAKRSGSSFTSDSSVNQMFRANNKDYLHSGYDRGHLAAAANHRQSQEAMDNTFILSNVCPQIGKGLNRSKWNDVEKRGRAMVRKHDSVHVLTGPLYLPTVIGNEKFMKYKLIGDNNVAVPTHFFKVMVATSGNRGYHLESYVMPNEEIRDDLPISSFSVPKSSIERGSGFLIFDYIADSQYITINRHPNPDYIR